MLDPVERRVVLVNVVIVGMLAVIVAIGVGFVAIAGDPGAGPEPGEVWIEAEVGTTGRIVVLVRSTDSGTRAAVAEAVRRTFTDGGVPADIEEHEDARSGTVVTQVRTGDAVLGAEHDWRWDATSVGAALNDAGVSAARVTVDWPRVEGHVDADPPPDERFPTSGAKWDTWAPGQPLKIELALAPSSLGFEVALAFATITAFALLITAVSISVRRHQGALSKEQTEHWFLVSWLVSVVLWLVVLGAIVRTSDGFFTAHPGLVTWRPVAEFAPVAVVTFAGLWSFLGLMATKTRERERRRLAITR